MTKSYHLTLLLGGWWLLTFYLFNPSPTLLVAVGILYLILGQMPVAWQDSVENSHLPSNPPVSTITTHLLAISLPVFLLWSLYLPVLDQWWSYDDPCLLEYLHQIGPFQGFYSPANKLATDFYTPLQSLSLGLDYQWFGANPRAFYWHHLLAFMAVLIAGYGVFIQFLSPLIASMVLSLFVMTIPATEAIHYLMVRHYIEGLALALLSIWWYLQAIKRQKLWWAIFGSLLYLFAALAKEIYVPLVVLLPILSRSPLTIRLRLLIPFVIVALIYSLLRLHILGWENLIHQPYTREVLTWTKIAQLPTTFSNTMGWHEFWQLFPLLGVAIGLGVKFWQSLILPTAAPTRFATRFDNLKKVVKSIPHQPAGQTAASSRFDNFWKVVKSISHQPAGQTAASSRFDNFWKVVKSIPHQPDDHADEESRKFSQWRKVGITTIIWLSAILMPLIPIIPRLSSFHYFWLLPALLFSLGGGLALQAMTNYLVTPVWRQFAIMGGFFALFWLNLIPLPTEQARLHQLLQKQAEPGQLLWSAQLPNHTLIYDYYCAASLVYLREQLLPLSSATSVHWCLENDCICQALYSGQSGLIYNNQAPFWYSFQMPARHFADCGNSSELTVQLTLKPPTTLSWKLGPYQLGEYYIMTTLDRDSNFVAGNWKVRRPWEVGRFIQISPNGSHTFPPMLKPIIIIIRYVSPEGWETYSEAIALDPNQTNEYGLVEQFWSRSETPPTGWSRGFSR